MNQNIKCTDKTSQRKITIDNSDVGLLFGNNKPAQISIGITNVKAYTKYVVINWLNLFI